MQKLTVELKEKEKTYPIFIQSGALGQFQEICGNIIEGRRVFLLYDETLKSYAEKISQNLKIESDFSIQGGEQTKCFSKVQEICHWLLDHKVDRQSVLIVMGGGVVGDIGGFAASITLRGISFIQVPTTLLAMVDSAVGGKAGVNTQYGKNLIGSFYQPRAVLIDPDVLKTLPAREFKAGYVECVKHAALADSDLFAWYEDHLDPILKLDPDILEEMIARNCQIKADIVSQDEKEQGHRALLNLGHTFGHALEAACAYDGRLLHGEAVAIGMVCAFELSCRMGLCSANETKRIKTHFEKTGLPVHLSDIPDFNVEAETFIDLMYRDKKASNNKIGFILVSGIGEAFQNYDVDMGLVKNILQDMM